MGVRTPTFSKYDIRDLFKNVKELFQEGRFSAFARILRAWTQNFSGLHPYTRCYQNSGYASEWGRDKLTKFLIFT